MRDSRGEKVFLKKHFFSTGRHCNFCADLPIAPNSPTRAKRGARPNYYFKSVSRETFFINKFQLISFFQATSYLSRAFSPSLFLIRFSSHHIQANQKIRAVNVENAYALCCSAHNADCVYFQTKGFSLCGDTNDFVIV